MLTLAATAFVLGLLFNATPGAVFVETVRRGMAGGFRPALAVQFGSLVGDALWAALGLAGAGSLLQVSALRWPLGVAGVLYLAWLSLDSSRMACRGKPVAQEAAVLPARSALRSGMLLSVTNPQNLAYWAAIGTSIGGLGMNHAEAAHYAVFFVSFLASSLVWCFLCAGLIGALATRSDVRWVRATHGLCALALMALAFSSVIDLLTSYPHSTPRHEVPWPR